MSDKADPVMNLTVYRKLMQYLNSGIQSRMRVMTNNRLNTCQLQRMTRLSFWNFLKYARYMSFRHIVKYKIKNPKAATKRIESMVY